MFPMTDEPSNSDTACLAADGVENVIFPVPRCFLDFIS